MSPSCLLAALFLVGVAQAQLIEWTVDDYPNPMVEPMKCGRPKGKMTKVCDPNGILSKKDGKRFYFAYLCRLLITFAISLDPDQA